MKECQESKRTMFENINSRDRDSTIQTLIALGRSLPDVHKSKHAIHALYVSSEDDDAISI